MVQASNTLLPSGLIDVLAPEAAAEADAIHALMKLYEGYGYARVKPPLAEFEDSLFSGGPGQALSSESFRLMDPVSQKMMALRSDVTPQIARLAASRLSKEERPLRLAYAGEVLRVSGSQLRPERELCKVGCEVIGAESIEADIEIAVLAVMGLKEIGLSGITLDLAIPPLIGAVYEAFAVDANVRAVFDQALEKRDHDGLAQMGEAGKTLAALMGCMGESGSALNALKRLDLPDAAGSLINALERLEARVKSAFADLGHTDAQVSLDPVERRGFGYHTGAAFTLFAENVRGELGRGGRYTLGSGETATGFTLYMDSLRRVLPKCAGGDVIDVPAETSWAELESLRKAGKGVRRGLAQG